MRRVGRALRCRPSSNMDSPSQIADKLRVLRARIGSREAAVGNAAGTEPVRSRRAASTSYRTGTAGYTEQTAAVARPFTTSYTLTSPPTRSPAGGGGALGGLGLAPYAAPNRRPGVEGSVASAPRYASSSSGVHDVAVDYVRARPVAAAAAGSRPLYPPALGAAPVATAASRPVYPPSLGAASGLYSARRDESSLMRDATAASGLTPRDLAFYSGARVTSGADAGGTGGGYAYSAPLARPAVMGSQLPVKAGGVGLGSRSQLSARDSESKAGGVRDTPGALLQPSMMPSARRPEPAAAALSQQQQQQLVVDPIGRGTASRAGVVSSSYATESGFPRPSAVSRSSSTGVPPPAAAASSEPRGLVGLMNLGNTCFMNSVISCLSNVPQLARYFTSGRYAADLNRTARGTRGRLAIAYGELMSSIWVDPPRPLGAFEQPSKLKAIVGTVAARFLGYDQQDAQELLRFLLDALHEDVNRVRVPPPYVELAEDPRASDAAMSEEWWRNYSARNDSELSALFAGQLKTTVVCGACGGRSRAFDPMWDWSLPIPKAAAFRDKIAGGVAAGSSVSLEDCCAKFVEEEALSGDDASYCARCGKHQPCRKRTTLYRPPRVLVIHLKRFNFSFVRRSKITSAVSFPARGFDVRPFVDPESPFLRGPGVRPYHCVAVSNHSGSLGGGHYTAHALNRDDKSWWLFNDSRVSPAREGQLSQTDAYMLFYVQDS